MDTADVGVADVGLGTGCDVERAPSRITGALKFMLGGG
jgi:hypothetical protein